MSRVAAAFGESALLLPATILLALYLLWIGQRGLALAVVVTIGAVGATTLALKIVFHACGHELPGMDVMSPSGHVSLATAFYGALAAMLAANRTSRQARLIWAGAAFLVLAIGASRIRTHAHTPPEVVIGFAIGLSALALFLALHRRLGGPSLSPLPLGIGFAAALLALGGLHLSVEGRIGRFARQVSSAFEVCDEPQPDGRAWRRFGVELGTGLRPGAGPRPRA